MPGLRSTGTRVCTWECFVLARSQRWTPGFWTWWWSILLWETLCLSGTSQIPLVFRALTVLSWLLSSQTWVSASFGQGRWTQRRVFGEGFVFTWWRTADCRLASAWEWALASNRPTCPSSLESGVSSQRLNFQSLVSLPRFASTPTEQQFSYRLKFV